MLVLQRSWTGGGPALNDTSSALHTTGVIFFFAVVCNMEELQKEISQPK